MADQEVKMMGRYQLLTLLASGGMAEIHLARHVGIKGFERLVVIKRIHPHLARDQRFVEMFFDEARIAAQLNHPNVVQIFDLGQEGDEYFIAMEYLEGESLGFLAREGRKTENPMPAELAAGIVAQVCDGLEYAHTLSDNNGRPLNIVHRDVSPHNVIVLYSGLVKLVDFGIAKAASQVHQTYTGDMKGKLSYMPPEQCMTKPVDARSDVFSLGVVFWELLTQRRLFKAKNEVAMLRAILNKPIPSPLHYNQSIDPDLSAIAERALQRNPERRFKSAGEMCSNIRDVLRKGSSAAGVADIAAYVKKVLAGRERTKKAILRALQKEGNMPFPLQILKPEKAESSDTSLSSELSAEDMEAEEEHAPTQAESPLGRRLGWGAPTPSGRHPERPFQTRVWIIIPALILGILIGGWWVASMSADPDGKAREVTGDNKPEIASVAPAPAEPPKDPVLEKKPETPVSVDAGQPVAVKVEQPDENPKRPVKKHRRTDGHGKKSRARRRPRKKADGFLRLDTSPWSIVYLGKRKLGLTPLVGIKLPAGTHTLTAVNDERDLKKTIQVTITPGKTTMLQVKLKK